MEEKDGGVYIMTLLIIFASSIFFPCIGCKFCVNVINLT